MDTNKIFDFSKKELEKKIINLTEKNFFESKIDILKLIRFMDALLDLPSQQQEPSDVDQILEHGGEDQLRVVEGDVVKEENPNNIYEFEQGLKGGILKGSNIHVPETIARSLYLNNGDWVKPKQTSEPGKYFFEVVHKIETPTNNRVLIDHCLVEKEGPEWYAKYYFDSGIKKEIAANYPIGPVKIKDYEIDKNHLQNGSLVDIAYFKENPSINKVIWNHVTETDYVKPLPAGYYKKTETEKVGISKEKLLSGKRILVVGGDPWAEQYREIIRSHGGYMEHSDGNEPHHRYAAMLRKVDGMVIHIEHMSHYASKTGVQICKDLNKPFEKAKSTGVNSTLEACLALFKEQNISV